MLVDKQYASHTHDEDVIRDIDADDNSVVDMHNVYDDLSLICHRHHAIAMAKPLIGPAERLIMIVTSMTWERVTCTTRLTMICMMTKQCQPHIESYLPLSSCENLPCSPCNIFRCTRFRCQYLRMIAFPTLSKTKVCSRSGRSESPHCLVSQIVAWLLF